MTCVHSGSTLKLSLTLCAARGCIFSRQDLNFVLVRVFLLAATNDDRDNDAQPDDRNDNGDDDDVSCFLIQSTVDVIELLKVVLHSVCSSIGLVVCTVVVRSFIFYVAREINCKKA